MAVRNDPAALRISLGFRKDPKSLKQQLCSWRKLLKLFVIHRCVERGFEVMTIRTAVCELQHFDQANA